MLKEANTVRYPVYFRSKMTKPPVDRKGTHAHARKRLSRLRVVCYKFWRNCAKIMGFFYYLQVEWSANSLFGRRQIPQQTFLIVVLFDRSSSMTVRKPQTE